MTSNRLRALVIVSAVAVATSGCATIISGNSQTITINSTPSGAHVRIGHQTGTTPVTLHVPKGDSYPIEISHGPDTRVLPLNRNIDPMTLLNIIPPLWPGFIVDAVTGCIMKYNPDVITVDFRLGPGSGDAHLTRFHSRR